ncbi:MAG: formate--tetrahydrofolate ligase [Fimbriimonadaceae bacterium]|nr:formate--tetrahydrofolate ligase [Fimbriimonadaceae bacterium]
MTNLEIAQKAKLEPIDRIAHGVGLSDDDFEPLGRYKAKLSQQAITRLTSSEKRGKLILVTAVNPTPAGEGKTTVSIGLAQGLNRLGRKAMPALREPALGPVFGVKGGACGGGYSQVLPMEDINLFFTGDFPAITAAHGLLSAMLDASLHFDNPQHLDQRKVWWPRAVDMIDRSLRDIVVGLGDGNGPVRSDRFVITPASEVMATLCLATSLADLKARLSRIIVGLRADNSPVTAGDLGAAGAMAALLRDAIRPNLVQTMEGGAALLHGGPFGNVAHGCSSVLGTRCGLSMADYLVTEGGFGSDLGGEKFLNIVCPALGTQPDAIVLVATVRALRYHGEGDLERGCENLDQHIRHLTSYGPPVIVTVNRFADDTDDDIEAVASFARARGVIAVESNPWNCGGTGCETLAEAVIEEAQHASTFQNIYERSDDLATKLTKLVQKVYGGRGVVFEKAAAKRLKWAEDHGYADLPVCVAKTQMSLSDDASLIGAPKDFDLHVRDLRLSAGAGFTVAVCGDIMLMPGMGKSPAALRIDVDDDGVIHGLN